jgi:hypothetical protein
VLSQRGSVRVVFAAPARIVASERWYATREAGRPTKKPGFVNRVSRVRGRPAVAGAARIAVAQTADNRRTDGGCAPAGGGAGPARFSTRQ